MTDAAADAAVVERWWRAFVADGTLPADLTLVQGRLVRTVSRGDLPSGPVYLKAMTFPRAKDRLRYAFRSLPAEHEAVMLRATASAGIPCPDVVAVRTERRFGLPFRSLLVLRALPVSARADMSSCERLADEAAMAARLLGAGIDHQDLHSGNFVRLDDGRLAVLDMQSARRRQSTESRRVAAAIRLLQDRADIAVETASAVLCASGLLPDVAAGVRAHAAAAVARQHFLRGRILRCFAVSTEFSRQIMWSGIEHRTRGELPAGAWRRGGRLLRRAWIGQRALQVLDGRPPVFPAFRRKWWWLGGGAELYVPRACDDRIEAEVAVAANGYARFSAQVLLPQQPRKEHGDQQT